MNTEQCITWLESEIRAFDFTLETDASPGNEDFKRNVMHETILEQLRAAQKMAKASAKVIHENKLEYDLTPWVDGTLTDALQDWKIAGGTNA